MKKIVILSVIAIQAIGTALLQVKTPVHEQSALRGIKIQVAEHGGSEKTEGRAKS